MITVYRKMKNGKEFMKIMDGVHALSVFTIDQSKLKGARIQYTNNSMMIRDYLSDECAMRSSAIEFNAAYRNATGLIKKFFDVE